MGIPVLYQGSLYAPVPFVPIPQPAPPTPSDPIGDALRADAVAYWRFEEADNTARIDSKNGVSLTSHNPTIQVIGKIGNAFRADSINNGYLDISTAPAGLGASGKLLYFTLWIRYLDTVNAFLVNKYSAMNGTEYSLMRTVSKLSIYNDEFFLDINPPANDGFFHFVEAVIDARTATPVFYLAVDRANFQSASGAVEIVSYNEYFEVGAGQGGTGAQDVDIDELGIFELNTLPTSDERDYLWNSGAGRTLYP